MRKILFISGLFFFAAITLTAQDLSKQAYHTSKIVKGFDTLVYHTILEQGWIEESDLYWYSTRTEKGIRYYLLNAEKGSKKDLFDAEKLCQSLNSDLKTNLRSTKLKLKSLKITDAGKSIEFVHKNKRYRCSLKSYKIEFIEDIDNKKGPYWGDAFDELGNEPIISPDSSWVCYINNYNVFVKNRKSAKTFQFSYDGSEGDLYSSYLTWSPDSKKLVTFKVREAKKRYMYFVESSPDSVFLPVLHKKQYLRPGDALTQKTPVLFSLDTKQKIDVLDLDIDNQFALENMKWSKDSKTFTFEYNQRGHQLYQVIRVNAESGKSGVLIEESSNTFIDYSGKHYRYDLDGGKQIIWASERDGWNHLYLFDGETGQLINQITSGKWVVRYVKEVNEEQKEIIFAAGGVHENEDPYNLHYFKVGFDGTGMQELTPELFSHSIHFSGSKKYFVDTYSNPYTAPTSVLRNAKDGKVLLEIEKANIDKLISAGYKMPEPFVSKGRDGTTDIWGNIYRPTNFDSTKSYPIIEYIYAGPQGSYVQKTFRPYMYAFSELVEMGFVVVQLDGMGTSNRSKAFQDVCFQNIKDAGFEDRIIWIKAAAEKYPYMDTSRVGIFGGSAGGQNSTAALLFHPEFYKVGVSSCGCHDNRLDKIWWNEQWMGFPIGEQYIESSNIENADKLQGRLMLIIGELDDNVDPNSTYRLADALIKADKEFDLVVLPGVKHTLGGKYGERKRKDFFVKYLLDKNTPAWNSMDK